MRTLTIGQDLERYLTLDSTNSEMLRRLKDEKLPEGKLILAEEQSEGRGQRGEDWQSEPGSDLTFSVLLYPQRLDAEEQFDISRAVTIGVAEAILYLYPSISDQLRIKWPNDILLKGKKVAGVLIENSVQGGRVTHSVVGIGFDLRSTQREMSLGHTSLETATGLIVDPDEMLERICKGLERRYFQLNDGDVKGIRESFNELCYLLGYWGYFRNGDKEFRARVREVDPSGRLVLEAENGDELRYGVKELNFLGPVH